MMTYARGRSGLRVGLLSITGAVLFSGLFFYSTDRVLGTTRSTIWIRLGSADGLQRGDAILHRGVNVGQVKAIEFSEGDVLVRVRLTRLVPVSANARAAMVAVDLFGRQSIVIHDGDGRGPALADGDTIRGEGPVSITGRIEDLGEQAGELLSDHTIELMRGTLHGAGTAASSAAAAASQIGSLVRTADELIGEQREALGELTRNASALARNLNEAAAAEDLVALRGLLETSAGNLATATASMDTAAAGLVRILAGLESGQGSAGRLLTDAALYDRVTGSLEALEMLIEDVRRNPKRYLTIEIF